MYMNSQFFFLNAEKATKPVFVSLFIQYHLKFYVTYKYLYCFAFVAKLIVRSIDTGLTMHGDFR